MCGSAIILLLLSFVCVNADLFLHNPRGSNNRNYESSRNRRNSNRLFDSQNNNRGGYNSAGTAVKYMKYYEGSVLPITWTNQHQCGGPNSNCELILQYMCNRDMRDGTVTSTIPESKNSLNNKRFGMHETPTYYETCKKTIRNGGLFTADQRLRGTTARSTRQNPRGARRGLECPEERDYYPYWRPSPWIDIAVLTYNLSRCEYYKKESANVKSRFYCKFEGGLPSRDIPITQKECEEKEYRGKKGIWTEYPSHGKPAPECLSPPKTRDNHLGTGPSGFYNTYNWTLPKVPENSNCVFRMRLNISTQDYDWSTTKIIRRKSPRFNCWRKCGRKGGRCNACGDDGYCCRKNWRGDNCPSEKLPNTGCINYHCCVYSNTSAYRYPPPATDIGKAIGINSLVAIGMNIVMKNNPIIYAYTSPLKYNKPLRLRLAINTAEYGRTFQDRSHIFRILERPTHLIGKTIHNLNVQGKRGNIVQVYPGIQYEFVPKRLIAKVNDYIHIQWTGSDNNPRNNDGNGPRGYDRNNMVLLKKPNFELLVNGSWGTNFPAQLNSPDTLLGLSLDARNKLATVNDPPIQNAMLVWYVVATTPLLYEVFIIVSINFNRQM